MTYPRSALPMRSDAISSIEAPVGRPGKLRGTLSVSSTAARLPNVRLPHAEPGSHRVRDPEHAEDRAQLLGRDGMFDDVRNRSCPEPSGRRDRLRPVVEFT